MGAWQAAGSSLANCSRLSARAKPGPATQRPAQPPAAAAKAAQAAPPQIKIQRAAWRSLDLGAGPRAGSAATGQAKGAAAALAEAGVERSTSSLPSGETDWAAAMVSPFSAISLGADSSANITGVSFLQLLQYRRRINTARLQNAEETSVGDEMMDFDNHIVCTAAAGHAAQMAPRLPQSPGGGGGSIKPRSAMLVPALYGATARGGGDEQLNSLRTRCRLLQTLLRLYAHRSSPILLVWLHLCNKPVPSRWYAISVLHTSSAQAHTGEAAVWQLHQC